MRNPSGSAGRRRTVCVVAMAVLMLAAFTMGGCRSRSRAILEESNVPVEADTVQASMPVSVATTADLAATTATGAALTAEGGTAEGPSSSGAVNAKLPKQVKKAPVGIWPAKVGQFSINVKSPVWYPRSIPATYAIDSLDVVEFDPGSGLVCDIAWVSGEKVIQLTQGSPKTRDYDIVSVGKVPWGTSTADVTHQDPTDNTTPIVIVYNKGGNFAELTGDVTDAELKAIAASMAEVK